MVREVAATAPVLVTRIDKSLTAEYQAITSELCAAGINTELYVGTQGIGKQFKYAADTGKIVAIVMGEDEMKAGQVSIKDLRLGDELSKEIGSDRRQWLEQQPAQFTAARSEVVSKVKETIERHQLSTVPRPRCPHQSSCFRVRLKRVATYQGPFLDPLPPPPGPPIPPCPPGPNDGAEIPRSPIRFRTAAKYAICRAV